MRAPSARNASTRPPIGRSCIRGAPESRYSPPASARTAVSGRKAVPAFLSARSADFTGNLPATPWTVTPSGVRSTSTPRRASASSITWVSSASSRPRTRVLPRASAASRSTRFEMLFDPGIFTLPATRAIGSRSRNFTARALRRTAPRRSFSPPWTRRGGARSATGWSTLLLAATPPRRLRRHPSSKEEGKIQALPSLRVPLPSLRVPLPSLRVLQPAVARAPRPREKRMERPAVAALEHPLHALELPAVAGELGEQRLAVGEADIAPHLGVAGGDAGEIAESPRRVGKELLRVFRARDLVDERVREHVRQVADGRQHRIVLPGPQLRDARSAALPRGAHQGERSRRGSFQRREHHPAPAVEPGERGFGAALLGARDLMPQNETRKRGFQLAPGERDHVLLGAARVGDDGLGTDERRDGAHHRSHLPDRHREQREIGVREGRAVERAGGVDYFQIERAPDVPAAAADSDHAAGRTRLLHRERERAADQADAHDHQLFDARHQSSSAVLSAPRNFSFSLGVPMVTRK